MGTATDYDIASLRREIQSLERRIGQISDLNNRHTDKIFNLQLKVDAIIAVAIYIAVVAIVVVPIVRSAP